MKRKLVSVAIIMLLATSIFPWYFAVQPVKASENLDLYTQRGGQGLSQASDAFGPYEVILLYANVTDGKLPVEGMNVTFSLYDSHDFLMYALQNTTDDYGIAVANYTPPVNCSDPECYFGNWTVSAETYVSGVPLNDTLRFEYGWLVEAMSVEPGVSVLSDWIPHTVFVQDLDTLDVRIQLRTISYAQINVTIAAVAIDETGVPFVYKWTNYTASDKKIENITVTLGSVPRFARRGIVEIDVAVLKGELIMSPQRTANFLLVSGRPAIAVPRDYPTIQEAIRASSFETTIFVSAGVYHEHVVVNSTVWIIGESDGKAIVDGEGIGTGLYVTAHLTRIVGLTIQNCSVGISVSNSSFNIFYHNNFKSNSNQFYLSNSFNNTWDNGYEGNYWNDYNGTDLDNDGIGDTELPWLNVDYFPVMNPLWNPADVNHDTVVDILDAILLASAFGSSPSEPNWNAACDLNENLVIDIFDAILLAGNYGQTII